MGFAVRHNLPARNLNLNHYTNTMEVLTRFFTENVNLLNLLVSTALNTFFVWVIVRWC